MKLESNQIIEEIKSHRITALAVDTSIFQKHGYKFESGLLAALNQFSDSHIKVAYSDVVLGEVRKHLREAAIESRKSIQGIINKINKTWLISEVDCKKNIDSLLPSISDEEFIDNRIAKFIKLTAGIEIFSKDWINISDLLCGYFSAQPPFEGTGSKKSEFPDAIALQSLQNWSQHHNVNTLVISDDNGWVNFCSTAPNLICINDLATALSYFQEAQKILADRLFELYKADVFDFKDPVLDEINQIMRSLRFHPQVSSGYFYEADIDEINLYEISIPSDDDESGNSPFLIVNQPNPTTVMAEVELIATVDIKCSFTFYLNDPIDHEEIPSGTNNATKEYSLKFRALITLEGNFEDPASEIKISKLEVNTPLDNYLITVDFGDITPDWQGK